MDEVYSFCEKIGLPTTLKELGIENVSKEHLMAAAEKACDPAEAIHHEAVEISPEKVLYALIAANAMGQWRKMK